MARAVEDTSEWIVEDGHSLFERYSVFDSVRERLACVPFKPQIHPAVPTLSHISFSCPAAKSRVGEALTWLREAFSLENLRHIPTVDKHLRDSSAVDILSMRHDADWAFL